MPSDAEIEKTLERGQRVDSMWKGLEEKLQQFERDKEEFEREFGFTIEKYLAYMANQAKEARAAAGPETLADIEAETARIQREFDEEVNQARARHEAEKQMETGCSSKRAHRQQHII